MALVIGSALVICAGCGASTSSTPSTPPPVPAPPAPPVAGASAHHHAAARHRPSHHHAGAHPHRVTARLAYSTASNQVVQRQPSPGTCHAIGSGSYARPDPSCTPGALNPAVTQATIHRTICVAGWTDTVRPPEAISEREKAASMASYGDTGSLAGFEYDHLVPLELGGATNDPRNLWPEPASSPNAKDDLEYLLNQRVCDGQLSLARAQREIAANWTALARTGPQGHAPTGPPSGAGSCTVTAAYNSRYHDYDVYVHSNQHDQTVTVTDGRGDSATWHTDAKGYADVFLHASRSASGTRVTARVGAATCSGTL